MWLLQRGDQLLQLLKEGSFGYWGLGRESGKVFSMDRKEGEACHHISFLGLEEA